MADTTKQLLQAVLIPEHREGLEHRIIRAGNTRRYGTAVRKGLFTPFRVSMMAVAASLVLMWVMPNGFTLPHANSTTQLADKTMDSALDEEMDNAWGEQWLEVAFNDH